MFFSYEELPNNIAASHKIRLDKYYKYIGRFINEIHKLRGEFLRIVTL